jgi:hypothetical protein
MPRPLGSATMPEVQPINVELVIRNYMMYFLLPMWIIPGFLDYLCHKWSHIETTSGLKEALIHQLFAIEIGAPVLLGLFLEINSLVILLMILCWAAHELTTFWDVSYASTARKITTMEQHVHDYLTVVPLMATTFVICLKWNAFLALFGAGPEPAVWTLELKRIPLPPTYLVFIISLYFFFTIVPYAEETWRCYRVWREQRAKPAMAPGKVGG